MVSEEHFTNFEKNSNGVKEKTLRKFKVNSLKGNIKNKPISE